MLAQPHYTQFLGMHIPPDIKPLPELTRESINTLIQRTSFNAVKELRISINSLQFRPNELQLHTFDLGANYTPDFDLSDQDEFDAWRKTCKLKFALQQFKNVDLVRCEHFLHKFQVCEALTLFEEIHRMLKLDCQLIIQVPDFFSTIKACSKILPSNLTKLSYFEQRLFSSSDSSGLFFNRTIWTFERLKTYLERSNFSKVNNLSKENSPDILLSATKETEITPNHSEQDWLQKQAQ